MVVRIMALIILCFASPAMADPPSTPGEVGDGGVYHATPLTLSPGDDITFKFLEGSLGQTVYICLDPWPETGEHIEKIEYPNAGGSQKTNQTVTVPSSYTGEWVFLRAKVFDPEFGAGWYGEGWWIQVDQTTITWSCSLLWPEPNLTIPYTGPAWQLQTSVTGAPPATVTDYKVSVTNVLHPELYLEERTTTEWGSGTEWPQASPGFPEITDDGSYKVEFGYTENAEYQVLNSYQFIFDGQTSSDWTAVIVQPTGTLEPMIQAWNLVVYEEGTPPAGADQWHFHVELVSDPTAYTIDITEDIVHADGTTQNWPTSLTPATDLGTYAMLIEYHDENGWNLLDLGEFIISEGGSGSAETPWDQSEIERLLSASEGGEADLEAIRNELTDLFPEEIPEITGDTGTGDPMTGSGLGGGMAGKMPGIGWEDRPFMDPYVLELPDTEGGKWEIQLQIDPRGWDAMGYDQLSELNTIRQKLRLFMIVLMTIVLAAKLLRALRQY